MHLDRLRDYCLAKPGTTESLPFGPDVLVFKVADKMFAAINIEEVESRVNLKCDPEEAATLRDRYEGVQPGYHMNKKHWNTVALGADVPGDEIRRLIDQSYTLVVAGLTKAKREQLENIHIG